MQKAHDCLAYVAQHALNGYERLTHKSLVGTRWLYDRAAQNSRNRLQFAAAVRAALPVDVKDKRDAWKLPAASGRKWPRRAKAKLKLVAVKQSSKAGRQGKF
jgi:hypothetical protein